MGNPAPGNWSRLISSVDNSQTTACGQHTTTANSRWLSPNASNRSNAFLQELIQQTSEITDIIRLCGFGGGMWRWSQSCLYGLSRWLILWIQLARVRILIEMIVLTGCWIRDVAAVCRLPVIAKDKVGQTWTVSQPTIAADIIGYLKHWAKLRAIYLR